MPQNSPVQKVQLRPDHLHRPISAVTFIVCTVLVGLALASSLNGRAFICAGVDFAKRDIRQGAPSLFPLVPSGMLFSIIY
ncbi:hypothetical protein CAOG_009629 [Capsaspora owczarzaki ATCC 30864]|uniref:Uncharacterized protein n=1 Tax=Capsaspora owczarzaki (strain ATCC 30864) TaxID=595528 RepID=A0A0D2VNX2_CAPO3|nr:hypothetical protein CAOG_009629 [Capsaspora owczarzaki ATCC 30864]